MREEHASDKVAPVMPRLGTDSCELGAAPVRCDDPSPHWCVTVIMRGWEAVLDTCTHIPQFPNSPRTLGDKDPLTQLSLLNDVAHLLSHGLLDT